MPRVDYDPPISWEDKRDVRIMWLWMALNRQVQKGKLSVLVRDEVMHDCFPPLNEDEGERG